MSSSTATLFQLAPLLQEVARVRYDLESGALLKATTSVWLPSATMSTWHSNQHMSDDNLVTWQEQALPGAKLSVWGMYIAT